MRGTSRLMAGLFAMQVIITGFCMITAEAHAMPQSAMHSSTMQSQDVGAHCAKADSASEHHKTHSGNCYHCDQPDELSNSGLASFATVAMLLPGVLGMQAPQQWHNVSSGLLAARTPTGPPRSSSLLFTTTQRIRI